MEITQTNLRYLLAVYELMGSNAGVAAVEVSRRMGVSKPSVTRMLGVLAICLIPFLQLAFHYLTYKLAAALIGTVSDKRLSDLLDSIGGAFGIVLGLTGACALMLLVSLASAVKAVTP